MLGLQTKFHSVYSFFECVHCVVKCTSATGTREIIIGHRNMQVGKHEKQVKCMYVHVQKKKIIIIMQCVVL